MERETSVYMALLARLKNAKKTSVTQTSQTKALRSRELYTNNIAFNFRYRGGGNVQF